MTEFVILDFPRFLSLEVNIEGLSSNDRNNTVNIWYIISEFHHKPN